MLMININVKHYIPTCNVSIYIYISYGNNFISGPTKGVQ